MAFNTFDPPIKRLSIRLNIHPSEYSWHSWSLAHLDFKQIFHQVSVEIFSSIARHFPPSPRRPTSVFFQSTNAYQSVYLDDCAVHWLLTLSIMTHINRLRKSASKSTTDDLRRRRRQSGDELSIVVGYSDRYFNFFLSIQMSKSNCLPLSSQQPWTDCYSKSASASVVVCIKHGLCEKGG